MYVKQCMYKEIHSNNLPDISMNKLTEQITHGSDDLVEVFEILFEAAIKYVCVLCCIHVNVARFNLLYP